MQVQTYPATVCANQALPFIKTPMAQTDQVFISYSHDSIEHMEKVRQLADKFRADGIDCDIDQYEETPAEGWPRWMARKINESKFVLIVCTETYKKRLDGKQEKGTGLGATWESGIIVNSLYELTGENLKFVPILLNFSDRNFIPEPLRPTTYYNLEKVAGYEELYRRLTYQPKVKRPELGKLKIPAPERRDPLPEKEIKTTPAMLVTSAIDMELWNAAKWSATFFVITDDSPPILGIAFRHEEQARKIFEGWRERFGNADDEDELRIAVIEGPIEGEEDGYSVHICLNPDAVIKRMTEMGMQREADLFLMVSRMNRMNPANGMENLERFKVSLEKHKEYLLTPGVLSADAKKLRYFSELGIIKRQVVFTHSSKVGPNDPDVVVTRRNLKKSERESSTKGR